MKSKIKKGHGRSGLFLRIACVALGVLLIAVIVFSALAFFEISRLKERAAAFGDSGADKIRIYIDQGHNPAPHHNSGAEGNGLYEQDLTFDIGHLLAELLREDGRFEVCLSRPEADTVLGTDNASSLKARVDGAAEFGADYFISLHINSYTQDTVNGIEVFVPGGDGDSYLFGSYLLEGMLDSTDLKDRGLKSGAELYVLKNAKTPAVLLEMGFISNEGDAALLAEQPELFAEGVYEGIVGHFEFLHSLNANALLFVIGISMALIVALAARFCLLQNDFPIFLTKRKKAL